jgi:hypothetical protein
MSRPSQSAVDTSQAELEEEEAVSGTGEGDEVMEEAGEQEGYSTSCITLFPAYIPISTFIVLFGVFRTWVVN